MLAHCAGDLDTTPATVVYGTRGPRTLSSHKKIARKQWRMIVANGQDVDGENVSYKEIATLLGVDTVSWPECKPKEGLAHIPRKKCEAVGLVAWEPITKIGTDCPPKDVTNPEEFPTEVPSSQKKAPQKKDGINPQWKVQVESKLQTLKNNFHDLKQGQAGQLGVMSLMLATQGVPEHIVKAQIDMYGLALPKSKPKAQLKPKPKAPAKPAKGRADDRVDAPEAKCTQVHDISEDGEDSDLLYEETAAEVRHKLLDEGFAADKVPFDNLNVPCLARCIDPNLIGYIVRARAHTMLVHILSNLYQGGI